MIEKLAQAGEEKDARPPPFTISSITFKFVVYSPISTLSLYSVVQAVLYMQGCEWNDKSVNQERESRTRIGSDATFFWDSCSNLDIDDNFRISHSLGLGLAANISTALAFQPDRDQEIEIILWFF